MKTKEYTEHFHYDEEVCDQHSLDYAFDKRFWTSLAMVKVIFQQGEPDDLDDFWDTVKPDSNGWYNLYEVFAYLGF